MSLETSENGLNITRKTPKNDEERSGRKEHLRRKRQKQKKRVEKGGNEEDGAVNIYILTLSKPTCTHARACMPAAYKKNEFEFRGRTERKRRVHKDRWKC